MLPLCISITDGPTVKKLLAWIPIVSPLHILSMPVASAYYPEVPVDNSETPSQHEWGDASLPDSDPSNLSELPPHSVALLGANSTLSTVLGTPGADLSSSLLSVG